MGMPAFQVQIFPNFLIESSSKNNGLYNVLCCKYLSDNFASRVNSRICLVIMDMDKHPRPNVFWKLWINEPHFRFMVDALCLSCYVLFIANACRPAMRCVAENRQCMEWGPSFTARQVRIHNVSNHRSRQERTWRLTSCLWPKPNHKTSLFLPLQTLRNPQ